MTMKMVFSHLSTVSSQTRRQLAGSFSEVKFINSIAVYLFISFIRPNVFARNYDTHTHTQKQKMKMTINVPAKSQCVD